MTSNQFALGLGKGAEIEQAQEESTAKRKVLGSERLADETDLEQQRRMEIANKMESVKEEVKSVLSSFYCDICDKQYAKVAEFDVRRMRWVKSEYPTVLFYLS